MKKITVLAGLFVVSLAPAALAGQYLGVPFELSWDSHTRNMTSLKPVGYVDSSGIEWKVPAPFVTDGASIPQIFWSFIGGPFDGPYRSAALIHDYYCQHQIRPWQDVHRMFYEAAVDAGTSEMKAKIMYAAVYHFGPRWGVGQGTRGPNASLSQEQQRKKLEEYKTWIEENNPPLSQIEAAR